LTPYYVQSARNAAVPLDSHDILFVAGFKHPPNEDAAAWLVEQVMPRVWAQRPDARLTLAGSHPTKRVRGLAGAQVTVTGSLSEDALLRCYQRARVAVIPLRIGAGVKFKTVEAMARGLPLVTTPVGVQGLDRLPAGMQVHECVQSMAESILRLMNDNAFWMQVSHLQRAYVDENFRLDSIVVDLLAATTPVRLTGADSGARALHEAEIGENRLRA
jgi:O-antigen biosynthesis protein